MKHQKALIIICSILFFLTALTFYLNRVIFPQLVKKIAIEHAQEALNRKVEIGTIHFNWFRGFIIDKVKIYDRNSNESVFAQADQISFGILIFPGFKQTRITIPFINVRSPSAHLVRTGPDTWNFSDMLTSSAPAALAPAPAAPAKPSPFQIAWGGISISDGKFQVDDMTRAPAWNEYFDNINLKLSLSYKGISYDLTAYIPDKKGFVGATVYYQPLTQNTQAQIRLKNIDTASYLALINIPDVHLDSGIIKEIDLKINYSKDKTSAQGDVVMSNLDIKNHDQSFKGDIAIHHLDALYANGDVTAHGEMAVSHVQTDVPGLSAGGSVEANVNEFEYTKDGVNFDGSIHAQDIFSSLKDRQFKADNVSLDNIKVRKDKNGVQSAGNIVVKGLDVQWPDQKLQGDISLKSMTMRMKDENDITLEGTLEAENITTTVAQKDFSCHHLLLEDAQVNILQLKDIMLNTKLSLDDMSLRLGDNLSISGSPQTNKLLFSLQDNVVKVSTTLSVAQGKVTLDHHKTINADPQIELNLQMPLNNPKQLTYKGSITLSDGAVHGFAPIQALDNIELDADFQNDAATINALSINVLDTNIRASGTIKNFSNPLLDITADAQDLNFAKLKDIAPQLVDEYGLSIDGSSAVKVKFTGLASDPLNGSVLAVASFKNISASSSKWHQHVSNITGIIEATPNTLKWRAMTAHYLNKDYGLSGSLENFKNPHIMAKLSGPDIELNADIIKSQDVVSIKSLTGKYLGASFDGNGSISMAPGQAPLMDINANASTLIENVVNLLPAAQQKMLKTLNPAGTVNFSASIKGSAADWKNYTSHVTLTCPLLTLMGYKMSDIKITSDQSGGKINNLIVDSKLYSGTVHAVGSMDLLSPSMPFDLALNIDATDMHQLKMDSPLRMEEIDGKFYFTTVSHGSMSDVKNTLTATGSLAIRDGFLAEFNLFKGLLGVLNDALRLGQVQITDVDGNFTIADQKITTDNLRMRGPTIVLLSKGWINFDQICDLDVNVDLSSGVVPAIAHDVLSTLNIHIYDKIGDPKFKKKISMPQVINSLIKNLLQ